VQLHAGGARCGAGDEVRVRGADAGAASDTTKGGVQLLSALHRVARGALVARSLPSPWLPLPLHTQAAHATAAEERPHTTHRHTNRQQPLDPPAVGAARGSPAAEDVVYEWCWLAGRRPAGSLETACRPEVWLGAQRV
jgi:hypothetical protein